MSQQMRSELSNDRPLLTSPCAALATAAILQRSIARGAGDPAQLQVATQISTRPSAVASVEYACHRRRRRIEKMPAAQKPLLFFESATTATMQARVIRINEMNGSNGPNSAARCTTCCFLRSGPLSIGISLHHPPRAADSLLLFPLSSLPPSSPSPRVCGSPHEWCGTILAAAWDGDSRLKRREERRASTPLRTTAATLTKLFSRSHSGHTHADPHRTHAPRTRSRFAPVLSSSHRPPQPRSRPPPNACNGRRCSHSPPRHQWRWIRPSR